MKLTTIYEADITRADYSSLGKEVGSAAADVAKSFIPGAELAERAGKLTMEIVNLVKNKKRATRLIKQAMTVPDNQREDLNIFDIDDDLWGPDGILSQHAQREIFNLVERALTDYVERKQTLPPNFANEIAITYIRSKTKG
jgi:hypothetical protein